MNIDIPGIGLVEFPDDMPQDQIAAHAKSIYQDTVAKSQRPLDGQSPDDWKRMKAEAARGGTIGQPAPQAQANMDGMNEQAMMAMRDPGAMKSLMLGAQQGATFGFGDEIAAGMLSMSPSITYDEGLNTVRGMQADAAAARPKTEMLGQVLGGGLVSGMGAGALGNAATIGGKAALGAGMGAVEGAAYGAGTGEGGAANRGVNAAKTALIGGAAGAATPFVMAGARKVGNAIANPVMSALNIGSENQASAAIARLMKRAGTDEQQLTGAIQQATAEGQPQFAVADALGLTGQRSLSGISRQPGEARQMISDMLNQRQGGQGSRLSSFVADSLGAPDTAAAREASLTAARKAAAKTAYGAASDGAGPVNLNGAIETIDALLKRDPILGETALSQGPIGARLNSLRDRLTKDGEQLIDFDTVLNIKSDLYQAMKRGNGSDEMNKAYSALDAALEDASDGYRKANDGFAKASRTIEAVDDGAKATSGRVRSDDTIARYGAKTPDDQSAFRAGYADPVIARIDNSAIGVNKARPLLADKPQAELGAMASDPEKLMRQIGRENTMFETAAQALGGSKTAENLADISDAKGMSASTLMNLLSGRWGAAAGQLGDKAMSAVTGQNPKTREIIAQMLLSQDPRAALAPMAKKLGGDAKKDAIASILARSMALRAQ